MCAGGGGWCLPFPDPAKVFGVSSHEKGGVCMQSFWLKMYRCGVSGIVSPIVSKSAPIWVGFECANAGGPHRGIFLWYRGEREVGTRQQPSRGHVPRITPWALAADSHAWHHPMQFGSPPAPPFPSDGPEFALEMGKGMPRLRMRHVYHRIWVC